MSVSIDESSSSLLVKRKNDHTHEVEEGGFESWKVWGSFDKSANDLDSRVNGNKNGKPFVSTAEQYVNYESSENQMSMLDAVPPQKKEKGKKTDLEPIPGFEGDLYVRGNCDKEVYNHKRYQYAMSSYDDKSFNPSIIACARNEADVIRVVKYANNQKIAVSIRTGKRHYN